jgi:very-short-patch-repair endonuclease
MDKKEYIIGQLARTRNKKYEAYVINRIIHLLNDFDIKFVTQQYVTRPEGRALTDLFFPQIDLHIEVDEPHHENIIEEDQTREADIINATNHKIERVVTSNSIEDINSKIDEIVESIRNKKQQLNDNNSFIPWNIDNEFDPNTYINRGYIAISDNVAFKTIKDACNCFGHNYVGYQRAGASHPNPDIMLWFPKLFPNGEWQNEITDDEETITERNLNDEIAINHIENHIQQRNGEKHKRIVFAKVRGNLGDTLYRFRGLYELNLQESSVQNGLIWKRISTRVNTFPQQAR